MILFYVDESGNTGLDLESVDQPIHWVAGIGIPERALREFESDMLSVALRWFRRRATESDFEFHGSHIFSGRGDCAGLQPGERVALYDEVTGLAARHGCTIFTVGIRKSSHKSRAKAKAYTPAHPHSLAMMYLLERVDLWLERQQPEAPLFEEAEEDPVYGLIVADEQKEIGRKIIEKFAYWRRAGTDYDHGREIRYLVDTVHYVRSEDSWGIQLVDCIAYLRNRYSKIMHSKGRAKETYSEAEIAVSRIWEKNCQPRVVAEYMWP